MTPPGSSDYKQAVYWILNEIKDKIKELEKLLSTHQKEVWEHIEDINKDISTIEGELGVIKEKVVEHLGETKVKVVKTFDRWWAIVYTIIGLVLAALADIAKNMLHIR